MTKKSLSGFTLMELLVVIAMIAILSTIAYPVFIGVQERAKALKDMNNLRQIGVATQLYLNDNDGILFSATPSWMMQLYPKYLPAWDVFQSPLDTRAPSDLGDITTPISYGINQNVAGTGLLANKIVTRPLLFYLLRRRIRSQPWSSKARPPRLRRGSQFSESAEPLLLFLPRRRACPAEMPSEARIVHATRSTRSLLTGMRKTCFGRRSRTIRPQQSIRIISVGARTLRSPSACGNSWRRT
jgi:prepilin-type N-terminal cleavage/methylation domain-containing protein